MASRDSAHLTALLSDTIRMLCQNGVNYSNSLKVQGLVVVTADTNQVYVVEISDTIPSSSATVADSSKPYNRSEVEMPDNRRYLVPKARGFPSRPLIAKRRGRPGLFGRGAPLRGLRRPCQPRMMPIATPPNTHQPATMPKLEPEDAVVVIDSPEQSDANVETKMEADWSSGDASGYGLPAALETGLDMYASDNGEVAQFRAATDFPQRQKRGRSSSAAATATRSFASGEFGSEALGGMVKQETWNYTEDQYDEGPNDEEASYQSDFDVRALHSELFNDVRLHWCKFGNCDRRFRHRRNLYRHQRKNHGGLYGVSRQVTCVCPVDTCRRVFYAERTFATHMRTVHGIVTTLGVQNI